MGTRLARHARASTAVLLIAGAYVAARPVSFSESELKATAGPLRFTAATLGEGAGAGHGRRIRAVHPRLRRIAGWVSSVGAGVALADLDGDGLPNDACLVDPRTDTVTVLPVPGTGDRYQPLRLEPPAVPNASATAPMGCVPADMDEDGRLDLLVYYWGRTPVAFLRRGNDRRPRYVATEILRSGERWYTNAATFADIDGDGHPDLIVGNYFPDGARILDTTAQGDEWMQQSMSRGRNGGSKQLLRWTRVDHGVPQYTPIDDWLPAELRHGWALAVGAADLDGDLRPEVYFANDFGPDQLLHNRSAGGRVWLAPVYGRRGFFTPSSKVVGRDSYKGMGVDFGDVNGDGHLDIYVSNIAAEYALEESHLLFVSTGDVAQLRHGVAPYTDRSEELGLSRSSWSWDARLADFDNDATLEAVQACGFLRGDVNRWPELHELAMGNDSLVSDPRHWARFQAGADLSGHEHLRFFVRRGGGTFHDVSAIVGTAQPQVTRGLAVADVDGDGLLDFAAANQWDPSVFYRNATQGAGAFLGLHILFPPPDDRTAATSVRAEPGHPANRRGSPAVGAVVSARDRDGHPLVAQVDGGTGHSGKRSPDVHLGLGAVAANAQVQTEVAWRDGSGVHHATLSLRPGWHTIWLPRR